MDAPRGGPARRTLLTGLLLAAAGLGAAWVVTESRPPFPVGAAILLAASAIVGFVPPRHMAGPVGPAVTGLIAVGLVATRLLAGDRVDELWFAGGAALGVSRWVQAAGLLVAAVSAVVLLIGPTRGGGSVERRPSDRTGRPSNQTERRPSDPAGRREGLVRAAQIVGLLVLAAIGAELLAAYSDSTGRPAQLVFAVVFFAALYGAPALLIREIARRHRWGWPSIIMLAVAAGILQPTVIDQALFSADYQDYDGWTRSLHGTFIEPLGFSATNALNFIPGHVIFSFCAPIAVAEAWRPHTAHTPWLGRPGLAAATLAYLAAAGLILADPESHSASAVQIVAALAAAGLSVGAAAVLGHRPAHTRPGTRPAPRLWVTVTGSFLILVAATAVPETWTGAAITATVLTAGAVVLARVSRRSDWSVQHAAAVATGALLSRGLLAFLYYPLIGQTSAVQKYTHNVVMLAAVGIAGWLALRTREVTTDGNRCQPVADPDPVPTP